MKYIILFLSLFVFEITYSQNIKKGFKNLEKREYEKAKESFQKIISEDHTNVGANFGMALVLADDSSTVFSIIDSWQYVEKVQSKIDNLSQEDIDIISEYFLNSEKRKTSRPAKKKIEIACEAIEARLIKYIREENNLDAVYEVIQRYPDFRYYDNVIHIRNQFEFRKYEKMNTIEGYKEFLLKFPGAAQVEKANNYIFKLAFEKAKTFNTVESYNEYIRSYPESELIQTAIKLRNAAAYNKLKIINTLQAYDQFINEYPDALEVGEARVKVQDLLYEQAKRIKSLEAYNDFIKRYPEGRYFIDIFNLKAADLGDQIIRDLKLTASSVEWARGFDDNNKIESGGVVAVTNQGEYILACNSRVNDTSNSDVWIIKLDKLGKMIWNKYIGQPFEDKVTNVLLDSKGDILVIGYTSLSADSSSMMGWMFKLGSDGKKLWNKNLGKLDINACAIDQNDHIYIGGSYADDSLQIRNYMLSVFNNEARKISERIFTGQGRINDLSINQNGQILISGSNWLSMFDNKRYLLWDDTLKSNLESMKCSIVSDGGVFTGAGKVSVFYTKYLQNGKKLWFLEYPKTDSLLIPVDIVSLTSALYAVAEQKASGAKIKYFFSDGKVDKVIDLDGNYKINGLATFGNSLSVVMNNGSLLIIKFTSETSF
jgi:hypothetical protein